MLFHLILRSKKNTLLSTFNNNEDYWQHAPVLYKTNHHGTVSIIDHCKMCKLVLFSNRQEM